LKLVNEFDVGVPVDRTWDTLLDVPRVARALPGAKIDPEADGGQWRGTMKIKLGPVTTEYAGTARVQDVDEDDHVASYRVEGREASGQGSAAATITTRLASSGDRTKVTVETDMQVTGRQAQLGRNLMEDVAGAILGEFAGRLEQELTSDGAPSATAAAASSSSEDDDVLDVSGAVAGAMQERATLIGVGLLVGLLLGWLLGRRRATPAYPPYPYPPEWPR
jgi:carbon monoxide dehydrogenase subunit G